MYRIKRFFNKIIKILQYIPLLWKDEDWDVAYLLRIIDFKVQKMVKYVRKNNYIIDEEIEEQERFAKKLHLTIGKYLDSHKYFPMQHYFDKYNTEIDFVCTGDVHKKYGKLSKMIDVFCDTGLEVPEGHEYYKYQNKYITRLQNYETAAWNRIWNMLKEYGYRLGD